MKSYLTVRHSQRERHRPRRGKSRMSQRASESVRWLDNRDVPERPVTRGPNDDPSISDDELIRRRTERFEAYTSQKNVFAARRDAPYTCPCCGDPTLAERGGYEMCSKCGWEDDGQDNHDSDVVRGGPNGSLSLEQARISYVRRGGVTQPHLPPSEAT
jgi:hypothetical protein